MVHINLVCMTINLFFLVFYSIIIERSIHMSYSIWEYLQDSYYKIYLLAKDKKYMNTVVSIKQPKLIQKNKM
ncbi:hypothetical protein ABE47_12825 [Bacillus thuringiensis]|uniref:Uncharacterized protein n=1 Tax=Bacillus thuringiensis YBT-1518 TaxID=529122 RepID=A0A9W3KM47_BACTU|nr:hypothetical protein YBT1518_33586 [Bacillus thuringiensis YBT-1518]MBG9483231.1 hypothetical protein [Bacillus thuringiensis]MBG9497218.1 hypothetical protein [Bacillus thuringiensis]MBG9501677.1 hypothetical protein [Bacillus thuringiensis]MBG9510322.1 hypothetical protein [Bacillus thuringiensis]